MAQPLLRVNNLKTWYPVRKSSPFSKREFVKAVDGVSFDIGYGETVGLVGESGCGKSSLGRSLILLEQPSAGEIIIEAKKIKTSSPRSFKPFRSKVQMIFQDPFSSLNPRMTVHAMLKEVLSVHTAMSPEDKRLEIIRLLETVGLKGEWASRYPHQFSGGQRQRIGIARALAVQPKLIIADEAVSALDVRVQAQIVNLLKEIQEKTGVSYLFISHDLAVVENISHRVLVMYKGKIVEQGTAQEVCHAPQHEYTKKLLSAVPTV